MEQGRAEDATRAYLDQIGRYPLLSAEQEVDLAQRIEAGQMVDAQIALGALSLDSLTEARIADGRGARVQFITSNLRLVVTLARRYTTGELDLLDVIQLGNLGLIRAVDKFDWRKGYRFSTHAAWWIRQSIGVGTEQTARVIRLPRQAREEMNLVMAAAHRERHRTMDVGELAACVDLPLARVRQILGYPGAPLSLSYEAEGESRAPLEERLADGGALSPEEHGVSMALGASVLKALTVLPDAERRVIERRFGLAGAEPETLRSVALNLEMSLPTVSKLERSALERLRLEIVGGDA